MCTCVLIMTLLVNLNSDDAGVHNDNKEQEAKWKESHKRLKI